MSGAPTPPDGNSTRIKALERDVAQLTLRVNDRRLQKTSHRDTRLAITVEDSQYPEKTAVGWPKFPIKFIDAAYENAPGREDLDANNRWKERSDPADDFDVVALSINCSWIPPGTMVKATWQRPTNDLTDDGEVKGEWFIEVYASECYKAETLECSGAALGWPAKIFEFNPATEKFDKQVTDPKILGTDTGIVFVDDFHAQAWMALEAAEGEKNDVARVPYVDSATGEAKVRWITTSEHRLTRWVKADQAIPAFGSGPCTVWGYPEGSCTGGALLCTVTVCNGEPGEEGVREIKAGEVFMALNVQRNTFKAMYRNEPGGGAQAGVCFTLTSDRTRENDGGQPPKYFGRANATVEDTWGNPPVQPGANIQVRFCGTLWPAAVTGCTGLAVYDETQQIWVVIECQELASWVLFQLTADRTSPAAIEDVAATFLDWGGSGNGTFPPGNFFAGPAGVVQFEPSVYPYALNGSLGWAHLDTDIENTATNTGMRYKVQQVDQMSIEVSFSYGAICPGDSFQLQGGAYDPGDFFPFSQAHPGPINIINPYGHAQVSGDCKARFREDLSSAGFLVFELVEVSLQTYKVLLPPADASCNFMELEMQVETCKMPQASTQLRVTEAISEIRIDPNACDSVQSGSMVLDVFKFQYIKKNVVECGPPCDDPLPPDLAAACEYESQFCSTGEQVFYNAANPNELECYMPGSEPPGWVPCTTGTECDWVDSEQLKAYVGSAMTDWDIVDYCFQKTVATFMSFCPIEPEALPLEYCGSVCSSEELQDFEGVTMAEAGETIPPRSNVTFNASGQLILADNSDSSKTAWGYAPEGGAAGQQVQANSIGNVTGLSGLIPGATYYLGTGGTFVLESGLPSGGYTKQIVGKAQSATTMTYMRGEPREIQP